MEDKELVKTIEFIQGSYAKKLESYEIKLIKEELKGYTFDDFMKELKPPLLRRVEYFSVQRLHQIIEENKELQRLKESLGIKSFDELYEN